MSSRSYTPFINRRASGFEMKAFLCNLLVLRNTCVFCLCWVSILPELQVFLQAPIHSSALKHEGQWRRCIIFEVGATLIAHPSFPPLPDVGARPARSRRMAASPPSPILPSARAHHLVVCTTMPITWWYVLPCPCTYPCTCPCHHPS